MTKMWVVALLSSVALVGCGHDDNNDSSVGGVGQTKQEEPVKPGPKPDPVKPNYYEAFMTRDGCKVELIGTPMQTVHENNERVIKMWKVTLELNKIFKTYSLEIRGEFYHHPDGTSGSYMTRPYAYREGMMEYDDTGVYLSGARPTAVLTKSTDQYPSYLEFFVKDEDLKVTDVPGGILVRKTLYNCSL